jgi:membrane protease YdiL (CAAX protease family)
MCTPALAAGIVGRRGGSLIDGLTTTRLLLHLELRANIWAPIGVVVTAALATIGFGLTLGFGHGGEPQVTRFIGGLGSTAMLLPVLLLPALMEEIGWRGFLLARLAHLGEARAAAVTGLCWGLWHAPAIALVGFDYPHHRLLGILAICCFTIPFGMVLAWLRRRSGSLLAPAVAHAALNAMMPPLAIALPHSDSLLASPMGLLGALPFAIFAGLLLVQGGFVPAPAPAGSRPSAPAEPKAAGAVYP